MASCRLWIKQPSHDRDITGTVVMVLPNTSDNQHSSTLRAPATTVADDASRRSDQVDEATEPLPGPIITENEPNLKQTKNGIVLNPQPQDNPNDPLNWPMWRRDIALGAVSAFALLAGGQTPMLAPVMNVLGGEFNRPFHELTFLVGVFMASMGVGSAILAPIAVKYGKRLVYLVSMLIFLAGLIWGANATSYSSLMGARVLSGIGCSPAESLPSTTIAEIYFAHERAYRIGIYTLLLLGGKNLSPLASSFTANRLGWHWIFWICVIICGASLVLMFFFVHETWWQRNPTPSKRSIEETEAARKVKQQLQSQSRSSESRNPAMVLERTHTIRSDNRETHCESHGQWSEKPENCIPGESSLGTQQSQLNEKGTEKRTPFFRNLAIFSGAKTDAQLWIIFLRPMMLYSYIPVLYATLIYGSSVVWLSVIAETITAIFSKEPYYFKSTSIGLLYIAMFLGSIIGSMVAGKCSDVLVRMICKRGGGVYEPEYRLIMMIPVMIAITIGLMGFGWSTHIHDHWIVPAVFLAFLGFGTSLASTVSITYVVDCYRRYALECLVSLNFAKNMMGLGFSIFVPYFFDAAGSKTSYIVYGCVEIALCLLSIPLYRYGKLIRSFYDQKAWIEKLYR